MLGKLEHWVLGMWCILLVLTACVFAIPGCGPTGDTIEPPTSEEYDRVLRELQRVRELYGVYGGLPE